MNSKLAFWRGAAAVLAAVLVVRELGGSVGSAAMAQNVGRKTDIVATPVDARPAALVSGHPLNWGDLRPLLSELSGGEALREAVLDLMLDDAIRRSNMVITADTLAGEQKLLLETLNADLNQALRLLDELKERQHLGPERFARMLRRNAALRTMVKGQAQVSPASVEQMFDLLHGPRRQPRMIVVKTLAEADAVLGRLKAGENFADLATALSIDSSAARGGLLEPISLADPAYPRVLREALWLLAPGELSSPILLPENFAILKLDREVAGSGVEFAAARPEMEQLVRLGQERLLMEQTAKNLLSQPSVTVFDPSLQYAWDLWKKQNP